MVQKLPSEEERRNDKQGQTTFLKLEPGDTNSPKFSANFGSANPLKCGFNIASWCGTFN